MITASSGEVSFSDDLRIAPHIEIVALLKASTRYEIRKRDLPIKGWMQLILGIHTSDHGDFEVEATMGPECRVEGVFLSHHHSFYEPNTLEDSERRTFHEGVIATDLRGQCEFTWGHAFCKLDKEANRDWLVLIYSPFSNVPLHEREIYKMLMEHERTPDSL